MNNGGQNSHGDYSRYIEQSSKRVRDLLATDDRITIVSTGVPFLKATREYLLFLVQQTEEQHLRTERVARLVERMYCEERRLRTDGHACDADAREQVELLRRIRRLLDAIIKQVDEWHLVDDRLYESIQLLDARIRLLRGGERFSAAHAADQNKVDLKVVIPALVQCHEMDVNAKQIVFKTQVQANKFVLINPCRFYSILDCLMVSATTSVKQALKQQGRRAGLIKTGAREKQTDSGNLLEVSVADNGLGGDEEDEHPLLERPSSAAVLNLRTAKKLSHWYQGEFNVRSQYGVGTCVTVALNMGMLGGT